MKSKNVDMLNGSLNRSIVSFAVPIIITNVLSLCFTATDLIVVGRFCGSKAVAAVGATNTLVGFMVNFFFGLSSGAIAVLAQNIGAKDFDAVSRTVHTTVSLAAVSGVFLTVVGVAFSKTFLVWLGTPSDIIEQSALYLKIYFYGITLRMVYSFCAAILRAGGDTLTPMRYLSIGGFLNVGFNLFFVLVFDAGVAGVAYGTVISEAISSVLCVRALIKRTDALHFSFKKLSFDIKIISRIMAIGLPAGIQSSLFSISNMLIQSFVNSFGSTVVAGNSAAVSIGNFVATISGAFQSAATNFMGQNIGAKNYQRAKKIPWAVAKWVTVFMFGAGLIFFTFGKPLLGIYITDNPEAIEIGVMRLSIITLTYFICGFMETFTGAMRGMGKSLVPMLITLGGCCVLRIAYIYAVLSVPRFHNIQSVYLSYPITWIITTVAEIIAFYIAWDKMMSREKIKRQSM